MGVYASNNYNLTIPLTSLGPIMQQLRQLAVDKLIWDDWLDKEDSPELLAHVVGDLHGSDGDSPDVSINGSDVWITGYSSGKVGNSEAIEEILAKNGTTGIVHGDVEGEFFLIEYTGTDVQGHDGQITYPTYHGGLL